LLAKALSESFPHCSHIAINLLAPLNVSHFALKFAVSFIEERLRNDVLKLFVDFLHLNFVRPWASAEIISLPARRSSPGWRQEMRGASQSAQRNRAAVRADYTRA
jgi:hypothetical protein